MSLNGNEQNVVGGDKPDAANADLVRNRKRALSPALPDPQPVKKSPFSDSAQVDGDNANREDSCSSGGTDWSMYVNYLSCTPERASSPILAASYADSIPEVANEVEVPSVLSVLDLQPASQAADNPVDQAVGVPEAQVPTSAPPKDDPPPKPGYSNLCQPYWIFNRRSISKAVAGQGDSDTPLAHPLDISGYFHGVSSELVRCRISRDRYLWLREQINHRITEALADSDKDSKSGRSDH